MPSAIFPCVAWSVFASRVSRMLKKNKKETAKILHRMKEDPGAFVLLAAEVIRRHAWTAVLEQASGTKPTTTVASVQTYAIRRVLVMAESDHSDRNEMRAWARLADLTKVSTLQDSSAFTPPRAPRDQGAKRTGDAASVASASRRTQEPRARRKTP